MSDLIGPAGMLLHIILQHDGQNGSREVRIPRNERQDSRNRGFAARYDLSRPMSFALNFGYADIGHGSHGCDRTFHQAQALVDLGRHWNSCWEISHPLLPLKVGIA